MSEQQVIKETKENKQESGPGFTNSNTVTTTTTTDTSSKRPQIPFSEWVTDLFSDHKVFFTVLGLIIAGVVTITRVESFATQQKIQLSEVETKLDARLADAVAEDKEVKSEMRDLLSKIDNKLVNMDNRLHSDIRDLDSRLRAVELNTRVLPLSVPVDASTSTIRPGRESVQSRKR